VLNKEARPWWPGLREESLHIQVYSMAWGKHATIFKVLSRAVCWGWRVLEGLGGLTGFGRASTYLDAG
jgi:hypothetical protein